MALSMHAPCVPLPRSLFDLQCHAMAWWPLIGPPLFRPLTDSELGITKYNELVDRTVTAGSRDR